MSSPSSRRSATQPPLLVDVVFGNAAVRSRSPSWLGWLAALALHAVLFVLARQAGPSLETWSARVAAEVHRDLHASAPTEIESVPPPEAATAPETPPPPAEPEAPPQAAKPPSAEKPPTAPATPPAQAAAVVAAEPADPSAPVDLTGDSFVTGTASAYIGGATSTHGASDAAVAQRSAARAPAAAESGSPMPSKSQPVTLDNERWRCPWPAEALAQDWYEQAVIVRAWVRADGSVERASLVSDPGHGFGSAALACTLRTLFSPARDANGRPIRALSPPIRVRFTR